MDRNFIKAGATVTAVVFSAVFLCSSCAGTGGRQPAAQNASQTETPPKPELIAAVSPVYGAQAVQGANVKISYTPAADTKPDSVILTVGSRRIGTVEESGIGYPVGTKHPVGRTVYKITAYQGGDNQSRTGEFTVLPATAPSQYGCRVKREYPHDRTAYTQGLLFHNGVLYESTGIEGQSSLRKVEIATGKTLQNRNLPGNYFGEGLALLDGKLYQLTWQNNKALVYDLNTFDKVKEFDYGGEGWGLATDGRVLYMSDGTEKIRVLDPETFKPLHTIEAYTNRGKVMYLNELEWIRGELWANVYTSDDIVRIDPQTGAVTGVIDCSGLLSPGDITPQTDVFNGIAFDPVSGRIFVTGKNWNKLFEIEPVKK